MLGQISTILNFQLDVIDREAKQLTIAHSKWISNNNTNKTFEERSFLSIHTRRTGGSIQIFWRHIKWYKLKGKKNLKHYTTDIKKPSNSKGYTIDKLLSYAKDWERDQVEIIENQAGALRQKLKALHRVAFYNRIAISEFKSADNTLLSTIAEL